MVMLYKEKYSDLFTVIELKVNVGLGMALDIGLQHCRNELVARMDSDDISLPERCEKQVKLFESDENLVIVGSNIDEFWDNPTEIKCSRVVPSEHEQIVKK